MKRLVFLTILAFTSITAYAQQPSNAAIEAAKHDKLMNMLAAKSNGNGGNQITDLQPEQDCLGAIIVCQPTYFQPNSYTGAGNNPGEINNTTSCLGAGELNGVWYKILVVDNGYLGFNIAPNSAQDDYDWAVFNLTNNSCGDIANIATLEVACNFSGSTFPTAETGPNGVLVDVNNNGQPIPQNEALIPVVSGEVYYIYISNFSSTQSGYTLDFSPSTITLGNCSHIYGSIYLDLNNNCQLNLIDPPLAGQVVYMLPGPHYGITNANGLYHIGIPSGQTGTYQIYTQPLTPALDQSCPANPNYLTVQVNNTDSLYPGNNFAYLANNNVPCPALYVSNMAPFLRACCNNTRVVRICNQGSGVSDNGQLELTYMDNYINPTEFRINNTIVPYTQNGNVYTLNLPTQVIGQCVDVFVTETVASLDYVGQTACVLAHVLPDYNCGDIGGWDLSNVELTTSCNGDSAVSFTLQNIGDGDMLTPQNYTIYNGINVAQTATYQLQVGQSVTYTLPANGDVYVMQANQTDDNPYAEIISGFIQNCGDDGNTVSASIDMFYTDFGSLASDMDCNLIVNAYDPNDKSASPAGIGPQHFISAYDEIEYKIRFQNTGNDNANTVVLVDTLDANLDPATVRLGAATHNYTTEFTEGGILIFTFNNINLPPLQQDEAASIGAITYSVKQRWGLPINYTINNTAYIYFDTNPAIVTNTVFHNVKDNTTAISESSKGNIVATLYPNPASNSFVMKLNALKTGQSYSMQLFTSTGALVHEVGNIKTVENTVDVSTLASGLYYYRVLTTDGKTAAGRFVKE